LQTAATTADTGQVFESLDEAHWLLIQQEPISCALLKTMPAPF